MTFDLKLIISWLYRLCSRRPTFAQFRESGAECDHNQRSERVTHLPCGWSGRLQGGMDQVGFQGDPGHPHACYNAQLARVRATLCTVHVAVEHRQRYGRRSGPLHVPNQHWPHEESGTLICKFHPLPTPPNPAPPPQLALSIRQHLLQPQHDHLIRLKHIDFWLIL